MRNTVTESANAARGAGVLREQATLCLRELAAGFPGADPAGLVSVILRLGPRSRSPSQCFAMDELDPGERRLARVR
ncbi:MAG TPA: hypothetical protein VM694_28680, partial [Polyangium sp.]|nr:hypothetical protein [Polyangium sp.]